MSQADEKEYKVLLGFRASAESFINTFKNDIAKSNVKIKECEIKYSKLAIKQYVNDNPDTDVIIVMEYLEQSKPFMVNDFIEIQEKYENLKIIAVLVDNKKGTSYMKDLLNIGVFNALFEEDSSYENIANLIKKGRTRKDARIYYGATDTLAHTSGADIKQCINHIMSAKTSEELRNNALYVKEAVNERDLIMILQGISENTKEILKQYEEFSIYFNTDDVSNKANQTGKKIIPKGSLINITRPAKKEIVEKVVVEKVVVQQKVDLSEIINNTIVGFAGMKQRVGNTHQLLTAAYFLTKNDYKVAVIELLGYTNCIFSEIKDYFHSNSNDAFFTHEGVDFYSEFKMEELNQLINGKYNFILIDYGTYQENLRTEFERCSIQVITACYSEWEKKSIEVFIDKNINLNTGLNYNYLMQNIPGDMYMNFQEKYSDRIKVFFSEIGSPFLKSGNDGIKQIFKAYVGFNNEERSKRKKILLPFFKSEQKKKKEKQKVGPKPELIVKRNKIALRGKGIAFITSLKAGVGCSYFGMASANYLDNENMGNICFITDNKAAVSSEILNKSILCECSNISDELYLSYDFLIIDKGPLNRLNKEELKELRRADFKLMLCDADDTYLSNLSNFIRSLGPQSNDWHFVFNRLTKTKEKEVSKLMSNYQTYFISSFEMNEIRKKSVNHVFSEIYQKGVV